MNLQKTLSQAWSLQVKVIEILRTLSDLNHVVEVEKAKLEEQNVKKQSATDAERSAKRKEVELETSIAKSTRIRERTQKLLNGGQIVDVDSAQEQIDAISLQLESLEEAYLEALEEQDAQKEIQLRCDNFIALFQKSHRQALQNFQEQNRILNVEREDLEEEIEKILFPCNDRIREHFEKFKFRHPNLVVPIKASYCGHCSNRLPLDLVSEIKNTTNVYRCSTCRAFCIAD